MRTRLDRKTGEKTIPGNRKQNLRRRNKGYHRPQREYKTCPLCGKSVKSMLTAISVNEDMDPAHFDCVLKQLSETEDLKKGEKITYLGNGVFAVVKLKPGNNNGLNFTIVKKVQFENKDKKAEWRKKIGRRLKR